MMKRTISLILALCMLLSLSAVSFSAEGTEDKSGEVLTDWEYTVDDESGSVTLSKYIGEGSDVVVPAGFELGGRIYDTLAVSGTVFRGNTIVKSVTISEGVGFVNGSMRLLFGECSALTSADFSAVDTSTVTDMSYIFYNCTALKSFVFPSVDTSGVTTIRGMFSGCSALSSLDVKNLCTPEVTDMSFMFYNCGALKKLDLSSFDTANVVSIRSMFSLCSRLSGLTGYEDWDTSKVESMYQTFNKVAYSLSASTHVRIDLSRWDLSSLTNCGWCFQTCRAQEIIVPDNIPVMSAGFVNHAIRYAGESYTIPAGVRKIGYAHTFYDFATDDFVEFKVAEGNTAYQAIDGVLYSADGTEMLAVPRNKPFEDGVFEIPEGVSFLGELSFSRNYYIHTVVLPDSYEIEYVPLNDERYIVFEDTGNLNDGTNLSIAIYCYTGITDYAVKDSNPRYASVDGVIYSKDMTHVVAIPARYAKAIDVPEGAVHWDREALWAIGGSTVDNLLSNCPGVNIPASLRTMSDEQLEMINRLHGNRAGSENPFTITVAQGNTAFRLDEDGYLQPAIRITSQPEDAEAELNTTARTSFVAEGEGLRYQWYGRDPGQKDFWKSSIKSDTYSVKLIKNKIGREVYCVITDKYGNKAQTRTATLNVAYPEGYEPPAITVQPQSASADVGESLSVSFTAEGDGLKYQWYGRNKGQEKFWKSSIKSDTYTVTMNPTRSEREIYCVVTDRYGNTAQTDTVTISMRIPEGYELTAVSQPRDCAAAKGKKAVASFAVSGDGVKYQWYGCDPGQTRFWKSSIKSDTYSVAMIPAKSGRRIYCVATDKYGNTITSDTVTLSLKK